MSGKSASNHTTRGVTFRLYKADTPNDLPRFERAYVTPRFPDGIRGFDLAKASLDIQQETALFWFLGNLCPFELRGTSYFTLGESPIGDAAPLAPSPLDAFVVLSNEFGDSLQPYVRTGLGGALGDRWMWRPADPLTNTVGQTLPDAQLRKTIAAGLNQVAEAIERFAPPRAGIGHNGPPEDFPLTAEEREEAQQEIAAARSEIEDLTKPLDQTSLGWLRKLAARLGAWGLTALRFTGVNAARGAAGELGKEILKAAEAIDVSHTIHALLALISG